MNVPTETLKKLSYCFKQIGETPKIVFLTGAGISSESGIPTFRGTDGYWTVGSEHYQPQEMGTWKMFTVHPKSVWSWYLYRRSICAQAQPNAGHLSLVALDNTYKHNFTLITQNVDGLHLRAGNSLAQTYQIHGNINYMRCSLECTTTLHEIPLAPRDDLDKNYMISDEDFSTLTCPYCSSPTRPHVLWWDEYYNDELYFWNRSLQVGANTDILCIVGTSGATNLPNQVANQALHAEAIIIDVNIEQNHFSRLLESVSNGFALQGSSSDILPELVNLLTL